MFKNYSKYRVLELFFKDPLPEGGFQLREISRKINLAPKSVKIYLKQLEKEKLITKRLHRLHKYPLYYANRDNEYFKLLKVQDIVRKVYDSGLLDYLDNTCQPDVIILYGSASIGEDIRESDIDIYLRCNDKELDLYKYEQKLSRKIHLFFRKDFKKSSKEFMNNLINGIILKGYLNLYN